MRSFTPITILGVWLLLGLVDSNLAQDAKKEDKKPESSAQSDAPAAEAWSHAQKYMQPGKNHKELERFLGHWDMTTQIFMGPQGAAPEKGTAEATWLMPGRWLQWRYNTSMMGMPVEGFMLIGYDNFKQSFVTTSVSSFDTAMTHSEGDMDPSGQALVSYGTLDEYLSGEHDKMVKTVWRFVSPDKIVLEVHDLPIGEKNTKVMEFTFTRAKEEAATPAQAPAASGK